MEGEKLFSLLEEEVDVWNQWRQNNPQIKIDFSRKDLNKVNLKGANLDQVNLREAKLAGANLTGASLSGADLSQALLYMVNLSKANLSKANLRGANIIKADLSRASFIGTQFQRAFLIGANLTRGDFRDANLSGASLTAANLSHADFSGANLSAANLSRIQSLFTNFDSATLTGVCIEEWHANSFTNLNNVICDYIYLKATKQERCPSSGEFAPGDFSKLFQQALSTIDLIFRNSVDWEAFAYSFRKLQVENLSSELAIQSIENKGNGIIVIRVNVSPSADKPKIYSDFIQGYEFAYKLLEERYRTEFSSKDAQIVHYGEEVQRQREHINSLFYLLSQQQEVQKVMAENSGKVSHYNFQNPQFAGGLLDAQTVNAHQIGGNINNYTPHQRQNLAEAAAEIQQLLKQLEETNPTETERVIAALAADEIKNNPTLKARVIGALKSGGKEAFKEAVDNPLINILIAIIEGWQEAQ
ncbi:pentapeptide repeat-containing protein [Scytonema sp. PCC 10023]|uniref:pentapeptide repeat-containing protein n=1 Tax=Scytonema sp. PCC 10023 TaxID=1680591 RepID=UPI0039C6E722